LVQLGGLAAIIAGLSPLFKRIAQSAMPLAAALAAEAEGWIAVADRPDPAGIARAGPSE